MYRPEVVLKEPDWRDFRRELERFRFWIRGMEGRTVSFYGRVEAVKPCLQHVYEERQSRLLFQGWVALFAEGWLGTDRFRDRFYLGLSKGRQRRYRLAPGDEVDGAAWLTLPEGRLVLHNPIHLQAARRGGGIASQESGVLLGLRFGWPFPVQEERCFACPRGVLVQVVNAAHRPGLPRRELFCLEGYPSPRECAYGACSSIALERCSYGEPV